MSILDNKLVRKYFIHKDDDILSNARCICFADHVLNAMQQPIRKGERYLCSHDDGQTWQEETITGCPSDEPYHPFLLRLPDAFQKQEIEMSPFPCGCRWTYCSKEHAAKPTPSPEKCVDQHVLMCSCMANFRAKDAVDEKIQEIWDIWGKHGQNGLKDELRDLVRLAMETK